MSQEETTRLQKLGRQKAPVSQHSQQNGCQIYLQRAPIKATLVVTGMAGAKSATQAAKTCRVQCSSWRCAIPY